MAHDLLTLRIKNQEKIYKRSRNKQNKSFDQETALKKFFKGLALT